MRLDSPTYAPIDETAWASLTGKQTPQAATMRILATYFRDDAPVEVPLSAKCREGALRWKASSAFIFGRAKEELIAKMTRVDAGESTTVRKKYFTGTSSVGAKGFLAKAGRMGWGMRGGGAGDVSERGGCASKRKQGVRMSSCPATAWEEYL